MANQFLTLQEIARQGLPILQEQLVFPALINRDYDETFAKKGDTIQVERPAVYVADEFGGTINLQDINPHPILVKMDKIADVSVSVTAKQLALNVDNFNRLVLQPALVAIAEKINSDGLELYKYVNSYEGASGTTPDGLDDFANARKRLNKNKVPTVQRRAVWDPDADAKLSILDAIVNAEKSGSTQALREGAIGRIQGMENYMAQAVKTHTAGGYTALADVTASADVSAVNATDTVTGFKYTSATLTSAAGASTAKLSKGDIMTIDGKQYVVLEETAAAIAGVVTAKLYPQMSADITDKAVTFADRVARGHVSNLAFHPSAFTYVTRPLEPTPGAQSYTVNYNGLTLRVTMDYDITTKTTIMSIDTLYGYAALYPELATRVLG